VSTVTSVKLSGFKEFEAKLATLDRVLFEEIDGECEFAAEEWKELAKLATNPNIDTGRLHQSITAYRVSQMNYEVVSPMEYSAYLEWGTGTKVSVPADLIKYAIQFKGFKSVIGSRPYPFFFPQASIVRKNLFDKVKNILETTH
jgi:hypothetical protein